jgi:hypothetical protein
MKVNCTEENKTVQGFKGKTYTSQFHTLWPRAHFGTKRRNAEYIPSTQLRLSWRIVQSFPFPSPIPARWVWPEDCTKTKAMPLLAAILAMRLHTRRRRTTGSVNQD